jgi:hypothetical protein
MEPYISRREAIRTYYVRPTFFYPTYRTGLDLVNRVLRTQPVFFQRVFPRYDLSATLTRDTGLGPLIEKLPRYKYHFAPKGPPYGINLAKLGKISIEPWKGRQINFLV